MLIHCRSNRRHGSQQQPFHTSRLPTSPSWNSQCFHSVCIHGPIPLVQASILYHNARTFSTTITSPQPGRAPAGELGVLKGSGVPGGWSSWNLPLLLPYPEMPTDLTHQSPFRHRSAEDAALPKGILLHVYDGSPPLTGARRQLCKKRTNVSWRTQARGAR